MKRFVAFNIGLLALVLGFAAPTGGTVVQGTSGNTVTLAWDDNSEPDLAGYKVYWGRASRQYNNSPVPTVAPSPNPTYTTPALANGTWYFAVTAYNTAGLESGYSNEMSTTIATAPEPPKNLHIWLAQAIAWILRHLKFWG